MLELLDNPVWNTLTGRHAHFSVGNDRARRFARGFSPMLGFPDPARPDFAELEPYCSPGEHFYLSGWSGPVPAGWTLDAEAVMLQMVWQGGQPQGDTAPEALPLDASHAPQALALAELTRPGPFGLRTIELGEYFGIFDGERLLAMAGERMHLGALHEISGVCTHPDAQGRGHARRLMLKLIARQMARGETPFLHVMRHNENAHRLYERMGFKVHSERVVRVVSPAASPSSR